MPYNKRVRNAFDQYFEDFEFLKAFLVTRICFQIWRMGNPQVRYLTSLCVKKRELRWKKFFMMYQSLHFPIFIFDVCYFYFWCRNCDLYQIVILHTKVDIVWILKYFLIKYNQYNKEAIAILIYICYIISIIFCYLSFYVLTSRVISNWSNLFRIHYI